MVATLNTTVIQNASSSTANITLDTAGNVTGGANLVATGMPYGSSSFLRNRIINGDMRINQRNASVTASGYTVDRFQYVASVSSKGTLAQNTSIYPTGFNYSLGFTSSSAYSVGAGDYFAINQTIEGYNIADLGWGTANAKTVTLSFQVYSSLTGTFGGSLSSYASTRSYPFTYSISSANTWTTISITVPGDTTVSATNWKIDNNAGMNVWFGLGVGTTYSGAAGSWSGSAYYSATGATSVVGTSSATFYITSVQLEQGSVATPFERPLYSKQLDDCQRYYQMSYDYGTAPGTATNTGIIAFGVAINGATTGSGFIPFRVSMRATPSISYWDGAGNASKITIGGTSGQGNNYTPSGAPALIGLNGFSHPGQGVSGNITNWLHYAASAEL